ncbi:hypothetical protein ACQUEF_03575 [Vagococcus fluvialis]|uniref:hypothetical protein n=1 Tax=Vagococcus fluvialis TaxID=2738 RepID=UPI003D0D6E72
MRNSLQRLREQQSLSVNFISRMLKISSEEYYSFENSSTIDSDMLEKFSKLFGVDNIDIISDEKNTSSLNIDSLGFARQVSDITPRDKREIEKLINLQKKFN